MSYLMVVWGFAFSTRTAKCSSAAFIDFLQKVLGHGPFYFVYFCFNAEDSVIHV